MKMWTCSANGLGFLTGVHGLRTVHVLGRPVTLDGDLLGGCGRLLPGSAGRDDEDRRDRDWSERASWCAAVRGGVHDLTLRGGPGEEEPVDLHHQGRLVRGWLTALDKTGQRIGWTAYAARACWAATATSGRVGWVLYRGPSCRRARIVTWSARFTTCTIGPAAQPAHPGQGRRCSHTTVSTVFSSPRLPTWASSNWWSRLWTVTSLSSASCGVTTEAPPDAPARPGLAGRRPELNVVLSQLEAGSAVVVAGEAGMGKSRLVGTAASLTTDTFVAVRTVCPWPTRCPCFR